MQRGGGGGLYGDYFAGEIFGGGISPPLGIPKLQHLHCTADNLNFRRAKFLHLP